MTLQSNDPGMTPDTKVKPHKPRMGLSQRLRAYLFAGVLVTAPIFITFYLAWLFVTFVDGKIESLIPAQYNPETYLPFAIPGTRLNCSHIEFDVGWCANCGFLWSIMDAVF